MGDAGAEAEGGGRGGEPRGSPGGCRVRRGRRGRRLQEQEARAASERKVREEQKRAEEERKAWAAGGGGVRARWRASRS